MGRKRATSGDQSVCTSALRWAAALQLWSRTGICTWRALKKAKIGQNPVNRPGIGWEKTCISKLRGFRNDLIAERVEESAYTAKNRSMARYLHITRQKIIY